MAKLILKIPGETSYLSRIREFVLDFAKTLGFDEEGLGDIEMSVDEAATNIIRHGYDEDPDLPDENKVIEIEITKIDNGIEIAIQDRGKPYNPKNAPIPNLEKHFEQMKTHGLGIFAMKQFMDELEHNYISGKGNLITMRKYLKSE